MAPDKINSTAKTAFGRLLSQGEIGLAIGVIGIFVVLIIPIPPFLLDMLITVNISSTLLLLLVTLHAKRPLDLSTFPSILLFLTLFRLALNVAGHTADIITWIPEGK